MFSIKVHEPNVHGHAMHECTAYKVHPHADSSTIEMELKDGTIKNVKVLSGGLAYVTGDSGKTVDVIRPPSTPRTAQMRGGRV